MFKKEILNGATSKHVEHMNFRDESGFSNYDFKKQNYGEVEESVPQVPVGGKIILPPPK